MKNDTPLPKRKKVALFDPFLDTLGGGERHILSVIQALDQAGCEITIFWDEDLSIAFTKRFSLHFTHLTFAPNVFKKNDPFDKMKLLKSFDYFFYMTDGSYFFSTAKNNFVFAMVPQKSLYK